MSRHHAYNITLNYYDEQDTTDMVNFTDQCDYFVYGLEGCDKHHQHIHFSFHLKYAKTATSILKNFSKHHHIEVTKSIEHMHQYCLGYEWDKITQTYTIKCEHCGENPYLTDGKLPQNGKHKGTSKSDLVMTAIKEGKTMEELKELFPSFMMFHGSKVKQWINDKIQEPVTDTKYYLINEKMRYHIHKYATQTWGHEKTICMIGDLSHINHYDNIPPKDRVVILDMPSFSLPYGYKMWPFGSPIFYKYGYETKTVSAAIFIILTNLDLIPGYKNI